MEGQGGSLTLKNHPYHWITTRSFTTPSPISSWWQSIHSKPAGNNPTKWDRSGIVVESLGNDQYKIKVDGSGRLTLRNRRFLRAYTPVTPSIEHQPVTLPKTQNDNIQPLQQPIPLLDSNLPCDSSNPPLPSQEKSTPIAKPHDEAKDTHLTTTMEDRMMTGDIPGDHEHLSNSNPNGIPPPTIPETASSVDVPQPQSPPARPRRDRRPPKYYDTESGKWLARWVCQPS